MRWFRFYSCVLNDPKVQKLHPANFKHWINLLCLASENNPRGDLPSLDAIAYALRLRPFETERVLTFLLDAGLLDADGAPSSRRLSVHEWAARQRATDDVSARVRDHRKAKVSRDQPLTGACNVTDPLPVTEMQRTVDTEEIQRQNKDCADAPSEPLEEKILTPHQQAVKDIEDAYRSYDETPPKPGILAKWIKDHTHDGVLAKIHELGPAGQLANGPAYVFAALKGGNRHGKPSARTPAAIRQRRFTPQPFVYDPELDDTKPPV